MADENRRELPVNIEEEMKASYLDYAMSVIIGRALPDVRDGLKPVHRRVLYSMYELGNNYNRAHKKSARIVGEVIGKYHPHGDSAVYDTMVRMAQDFSMREPLVDGQGNFGSVDGDAPAAMRYTEVRMTRIAEELLADLDKDTVDFQNNYDESLQEPIVLPGKVPNLLINGTSGIAVGMATNIPPHNLGEVVDVLLHLLNQPEASLLDLMEILPGPDFPTGGFIHGQSGIQQAYMTGRGIFPIRAKTRFEEVRKDRMAIIIDELPYQVNKARLIEKIAQLVNQKRITSISDLRDESDRSGMRVVIELKRGEQPQIVLNTLFKLTAMQTSFGVIMLAIVDGRPQVLNLKQVLENFLLHRREVVRRRTRYELAKAQARAHILEGLRKALDHLDEIISLIRASANPSAARDGLILNFELTERQAQAILDMRLQRLTGLERDKINEEYQLVLHNISGLQEILENKETLRGVIQEELQAVKDRYQNPRRTVILEAEAELTIEDLIAEEQMVISVTHSGYIKRTSLDSYRSQHRGGKGRIGMSTRTDEDLVDYLFVASTHSYVLIFTDRGKMHWLKAWQIPQVSTSGQGKPLVNLIRIEPQEKVTTIITVRDFDDRFVVMASRSGYIKRTSLSAFSNPRVAGIIACSVDEGDTLIAAALANADDQIMLSTRQGKAIRFASSDVRAMGRTARGVKGIALRPGDSVVGMNIIEDQSIDILAVTENGYGKRTGVAEYRKQRRGGYGVINISTSERNGEVVATLPVLEKNEVVTITINGKIIRMQVDAIRHTVSRSAQGVRLIDLEKGDKVADVSLVPAEENEEAESDADESAETGE